jgi:rhamnose transport system substrate-binding protein
MRRLLPTLLLLFVALSGCTPPAAPSGDGGGGGNAPETRAGTIKLGMMPKKKGIPYFNACEKGAKEAAAELGDVDLLWDGPTEDKSEKQSEMLDTWVIQKLDALAVACNDPEQISPTLARARDEGLFAITWDADANAEASKRQFFVNQATVDALAHALVDEMVKQTAPDARVAVVSSSPTAPNQSAWLKEMNRYIKEKYPKLQIVSTEYAEENQVLSEQKAQSILKAFPDVQGIWGMTSVAFPGAASAVEKAGKAGQIAVVGLGTPKDMAPFVLDKGVVKSVILWNPVDLGYLTVHVARAVAKGELKPGATTFKAGRLGEVEVRGQEVLLGKPMVFDKDNIRDFDF